MSHEGRSVPEPVDRWLWFAGQVLAVVMMYYSATQFFDMQSAISPREYIEKYQALPKELMQCDAIAIPRKRARTYRCAKYGSSESNPAGCVAFVLLFLGSAIFLWKAGRRERGLPLQDWIDAGYKSWYRFWR